MNQAGVGRYGRYRIIPEAGVEHLADATAKGKDVNFLFDDLTRRLLAGPISFRIVVRVANEHDVVDNATIPWPEDRPLIDFGKLLLPERFPMTPVNRSRLSLTLFREWTGSSRRTIPCLSSVPRSISSADAGGVKLRNEFAERLSKSPAQADTLDGAPSRVVISIAPALHSRLPGRWRW